MSTIYTISSSHISVEDVISTLKYAGIQVVIDIRSIHTSDYLLLSYHKTALDALKDNSIIYMSFAEQFQNRLSNDIHFINGIDRLNQGLVKGYHIALWYNEGTDTDVLFRIRESLITHGITFEPIIPSKLPYFLAEDFSLRSNRCIFLTGKAGTGKTTFLKHLKNISSKNLAIVAPTGVAAINAGGMTIHALFQLPVRTLIPTPQSYSQIFAEQRMTQRKRNLLYHLEMLVIDEISMVRADVLDAIDAVLRHYKYRQDVPFGGVQVLMIGDLMQLSPVVANDEIDTMRKYYDSPYFFSSRVMQQLNIVFIELNHVYRQQNEKFIKLLNDVRDNKLSQESITLLASRYQPHFKNSDDNFHITLTTHNYIADTINKNKLAAISDNLFSFKATIKGSFPESSYPADEVLELKVGARVMFIRNDEKPQKRFYNGKLGIITDIGKTQIIVKCDDASIEVERMTWENILYREDEQTGKITEEQLGTYTQFPLRLAWAITIHKSQGLTFDRVIIDAEHAFTFGQVYVALSRCRTLEGIILSTPLQHISLRQEKSVIDYVNQQPSISETALSLNQAKSDYMQQILLDIFGMYRVRSLIDQMHNLVLTTVSFNADTHVFLSNVQKLSDTLYLVAQTFSSQIIQLLRNNNLSLLQHRLQAAVDYFTPRLQTIADQISDQPCRSKNKADANDYMVLVMDLFVTLHQKIAFMHAMAQDVSADAYLKAKKTFTVPQLKIQSILLQSKKKTKVIKPSRK